MGSVPVGNFRYGRISALGGSRSVSFVHKTGRRFRGFLTLGASMYLGWRGVNGKLAEKVIKKLSDLGSKPKDIMQRAFFTKEPESRFATVVVMK